MRNFTLSEHGIMRYRQRVRNATKQEILLHLESLPKGKRVACVRRERLTSFGPVTVVKSDGITFVFGDIPSRPDTQFLITVFKQKRRTVRERRMATRFTQEAKDEHDGFYRT